MTIFQTGPEETGYGAHHDNGPDADFDAVEAIDRIVQLTGLIAQADAAGYRFERDEVYGGNTPQDEIDELLSKLFIGPRRSMQIAWNDPMWDKMLDVAFQSNALFKYLSRQE